ncbi:MAG TPA: Maf family protein [Armatimonadota bacterium]|jgi:septum formation protein
MTPLPLILASASPRRFELMRQIGLDFEVRVSLIEEDITPPEHHPETYARTLAEHKAVDIGRGISDGIVIGADTIVVLDEQILNKPADEADALRMLSMLQGRTHQVITGLAVLEVRNGQTVRNVVEHVATDVTMREASEDELRAYVATGEPLDKAGAYAIQGRGSVFIEGIVGDYFNVVGLPLFTLAKILARIP